MFQEASRWPLHRRLAFYIASTAIACGVIAFMSFMLVTLRKAFELTSPWEVLGYFLIVIVALIVLARLSGLHETR